MYKTSFLILLLYLTTIVCFAQNATSTKATNDTNSITRNKELIDFTVQCDSIEMAQKKHQNITNICDDSINCKGTLYYHSSINDSIRIESDMQIQGKDIKPKQNNGTLIDSSNNPLDIHEATDFAMRDPFA